MENDFPRLLTLLRKERKLSQKQASQDLGISQALLSHYEKGIRECGLDFLVRAADYYNVSCDWLLGRAAERRVAGDAETAEPENGKDNVYRGSVIPQLGKALTVSAVSALFDLLRDPAFKQMAAELQKQFSILVYQLFRSYYALNPENPVTFFALDALTADDLCRAGMAQSSARLKLAAREAAPAAGELPPLTYDELQRRFPKEAPALLNILKNVENELKGKRGR